MSERKWGKMKQLTIDQAVAFGESKSYEYMTSEQIAKFQILQEKLCMPFSVFHKAVEDYLNRQVFSHEFALNYDGIEREIFGEKEAPTFDEIINLIPEEKRMAVIENEIS